MLERGLPLEYMRINGISFLFIILSLIIAGIYFSYILYTKYKKEDDSIFPKSTNKRYRRFQENKRGNSPLEVLKFKYAEGEITEEEYRKKKKVLEE